MLSIPELLKEIRTENHFTQQQLADAFCVSKVLIVMIENGTKEPSKKFIYKMSKSLKVHPSAIIPSIFPINEKEWENSSSVERRLVEAATILQKKLIKKKSKLLL